MVRIWKISPGDKGKAWEGPNGFKKNNVVAFGWWNPAMPDPINLSKEEMFDILRPMYTGSDVGLKGTVITSQLYPFLKEVQKGDLIIAYSDKQIFGIGKITGDHEYQKNMISFIREEKQNKCDLKYYRNKDMVEIYLPLVRKVNWLILKPAIELTNVLKETILYRELRKRPTFFEIKKEENKKKIIDLIKNKSLEVK